MARGWGYWTEAKLDILSAYLPAFTTASKAAGRTVYLDLFAGDASNHRRDTGADIKGSALRALEAFPPFTRLFLFELDPVAERLSTALRAGFLDREFEVVAGDCNVTIDAVLQRIRDENLGWAPMFAFVDPYSTTPLQWATLRKLADFKRHRKYKVELWILFYGSAIPRVLGIHDDVAQAPFTKLFGSDEWLPTAQARVDETLDADEARYEYTNLMRWRIEKVLGYRRTHTMQVTNTSGAYLYDLIFATDNEAGDTIMGDVYRKALSRNEKMRREAIAIRREERTGQGALFGPESMGEPDLAYVHEPPTPPFGSPFRTNPGQDQR